MNVLVMERALKDNSLQRRQRGMALIIAMVFMLLLTMLGLSAMQNTALQERMAGNQRDLHMAFQAAEAALREAERQIENRNENAIVEESWDSDAPVFTGSYDLSPEAAVAKSPEYHIHYLKEKTESNYPSPTGNSCEGVGRYYFITARGYGGNVNSQVDLVVEYFLPPNSCVDI